MFLCDNHWRFWKFSIFNNNIRREKLHLLTWLLLTFFKCLHNQLSSIHCIVTYWRVQMFEKCDSSIDRKWTVAPFSNFYGKIWVGFCVNPGKCFVLEISFKSQQKEQCNCTINFDDFSILATDSNKFKLLLRESLLIKRDKPILNRTIKSFPLELFD